jgi:valyl-tRNA synthetase
VHPPELRDRAAMAEMDWVVELISAIRTARSEMNVPAASEIAADVLDSGPEAVQWIERHNQAIKRLARLSRIAPAAAAERERLLSARSTIQVLAGGTTVALDLAGAVDLDKERARLAREAASVDGEIDKIERKLGNEQFLAKAKPEVVDEQKERLAEAQAARTRLRAALARLG